MPTVIVTGSARGIGRAAVLRLAADMKARDRDPVQFVLVDRLRDELESLLGEVRSMDCEAVAVDGDLSQPDFCSHVVATAEKSFGRIDLLVSNAGMYVAGALQDLDLDGWDRVLDVNVRATWLLARAGYPLLKESRGSIIVTASVSGLNPQPGLGAYAVSKAALIMLASQLAVEWAKDGIRTNMVSPGTVRTPNVEQFYRDPAIRARRERAVPLGRVATPEEIASVISFLASADASFCNGANIVADGGLTHTLMTYL